MNFAMHYLDNGVIGYEFSKYHLYGSNIINQHHYIIDSHVLIVCILYEKYLVLWNVFGANVSGSFGGLFIEGVHTSSEIIMGHTSNQ